MPVIGTTSCGDVPQVTVGTISAALMSTSRSYTAPGSDRRLAQYFVAFSHSGLPTFGASGLQRNVRNFVDNEIQESGDVSESHPTGEPWIKEQTASTRCVAAF